MQYFDSDKTTLSLLRPAEETLTPNRSTQGRSTQGMEAALAASMPMRVIVFSSQKGGSGKTTLCGQLAVQAELAGGGPVAVVDADPQGSLSEWWNARQSESPLFVKTKVDYLMSDLEELRGRGIKLVFVDTPPAVTEIIEKIVAYADLVVIPTRPSPHDLRAVGATLDIVEARDKPLLFVINGATPRAQITSQAAVALSQHGTVAPVTIHQRTDFATSMIDGRAVMETRPESRSAGEISELWQYLASRLGKVDRRREQIPFAGLDRRDPNRDRTYEEIMQPTVFGRRVSNSRPRIEEAV